MMERSPRAPVLRAMARVATDFSASSVKAISGRFVLVPLSADWPAPLRRWFGAPTETVEAKRPFLRVYDQ